jgi:hypothetical protein
LVASRENLGNKDCVYVLERKDLLMSLDPRDIFPWNCKLNKDYKGIESYGFKSYKLN